MTERAHDDEDERGDLCLFSLDVVDGMHARAKIYIIHGAIRHQLMTTIGIHRGSWCAILADRLGRVHVAKAIKQHHVHAGSAHEYAIPQLLYTWWMLDYCSMRVQRLTFGVNKMLRCCYCGAGSWWGLDASSRVRCIACILGDDDVLTRSPPGGIARVTPCPLTARSEVGDRCRSHWQSH